MSICGESSLRTQTNGTARETRAGLESQGQTVSATWGLQARHFQAVESSVFPANPFRSKPSLIFLPKLGNGGILVTSWFVCVVIA